MVNLPTEGVLDLALRPPPLPTRRWWCLALLLWTAVPSLVGEDVYFRSDLGLGHQVVATLPDHFDRTNLLRWRADLPSGHSSPVAIGGRVFVTTFAGESQQLATVALDRATGKVLWRQAAPAPRIETYHLRTGNAVQATPAADAERVYVFFGSVGLLAYRHDGQLAWEQRMGPFQDEYGSGSSPILIDDKVIVQQDHDVGSFLQALDRRTGRVIWRVARPDAVRSYATPAIWTQGGTRQLLVAGALELAGFDPGSGERLWWVNGLARVVIPTPLPAADTIYMASWAPGGDRGQRINLETWTQALAKWDKDGNSRLSRAEVGNPDVLERFFRMDVDQNGALDEKEWERHAAVFTRAQNSLLAIRPSGKGELAESAVLWRHTRGLPYVASPLLYEGSVWIVKDGGIASQLEASSGKLLREERLPGPGSYYASPVAANGKVYFASEAGVVSVVAAAASEWRVVSSYDFKERIFATPWLERDSILIRTEKCLYHFGPKPE